MTQAQNPRRGRNLQRLAVDENPSQGPAPLGADQLPGAPASLASTSESTGLACGSSATSRDTLSSRAVASRTSISPAIAAAIRTPCDRCFVHDMKNLSFGRIDEPEPRRCHLDRPTADSQYSAAVLACYACAPAANVSGTARRLIRSRIGDHCRLRRYLKTARNPACSKWRSAVSASDSPRSLMTPKEIQSVRDHALSGRAANKSKPAW